MRGCLKVSAQLPRVGLTLLAALTAMLRRVVVSGDTQQDARAKQSHLAILMHAWFFFEVVLKSMAEYLHSQRLVKCVRNSRAAELTRGIRVSRENRFSPLFQQNIYELVMNLVFAICEVRQ